MIAIPGDEQDKVLSTPYRRNNGLSAIWLFPSLLLLSCCDGALLKNDSERFDWLNSRRA